MSGGGSLLTIQGGKVVGQNVYHSFQTFNIQPGQTASFDANVGTRHILTRVTGGSPSSIRGTLRCAVPGASVYLVNPNGVVFGPGAVIDVRGDFAATTANHIRLSDGVRFLAAPSPADNLLTTATPESFGFLGSQAVRVGDVDLAVSEEVSQLTFAGGSVVMIRSTLTSPGGRVRLVAEGSGSNNHIGRVRLVKSGVSVSSAGEASPGTIQVTADRTLIKGDSTAGLRASSNLVSGQGGRIRIDSGRLVMSDGAVSADASGRIGQNNEGGRGGVIRVDSERLVMRRGAEISAVAADTTGRGGDIHIKASDRLIVRGSRVEARAAEGVGGRVVIRAGEIDMIGGGISAQADRGGVVLLGALRSISILGEGSNPESEPDILASGTRRGGRIQLLASDEIRMSQATIASQANLEGGLIFIDPQLVLLQNGSTIRGRVGVNPELAGSGNDTLVRVVADAFLVSGDSAILSSRQAFEPADVASQLSPLRDAAVTRDLSIDTTCTKIDMGRVSSLITKGRGGMMQAHDWIAPANIDW